jgi:MerE protein
MRGERQVIASAGKQQGPACASMTREQAEKRGWLWIIGAFVICPCHLPLTLWLLTLLLSGTAAAAWISEHPYMAGAMITVAWIAPTWRGLQLLRARGESCTR